MARLKADVRDYTSAREFLGLPAVFDPQDSSLSDRQLDRKLGHNTMVSLQTAGLGEGSISVWLHRTPVVRFYSDGRVRLSSGGWHTPTTADRIRQTLPMGFRLESRRGRYHGAPSEWFIVDARPGRFPPREALFTDGMLINTNTAGNPFGG
jgi:hypothetical protein